jgi:hypothetical protein
MRNKEKKITAFSVCTLLAIISYIIKDQLKNTGKKIFKIVWQIFGIAAIVLFFMSIAKD